MLNGFFALGGTQIPPDLPLFEKYYSGNHLGSRNRGQWALDSDLTVTNLNIPSRDKQVQLLSSTDHGVFAQLMSVVDSEYDQQNYRGKLNIIQRQLGGSFTGVVNNLSTSTHGSLAIITNEVPLYFFGLHDTELDYSYLMWTDNLNFLAALLEAKPLRYLLYRMPALRNGAVFLPGEIICARWWRLTKNHSSSLYAMNALERRLFGPILSE